MSASQTLLVELGVEELPPLSLRRLSEALANELVTRLRATGLEIGAAAAFATPRRLAVQIASVPAGEADREELQRGPPVAIAFDDAGIASKAAEAFAKRCGVSVTELHRIKTDKGEWLGFNQKVPGRALADVIDEILPAALAALPIDRRMRWGDGNYEFVRPLHWLVVLHGADVLPTCCFGVAANRYTRGHRFHAPDPIELGTADVYVDTLREHGKVLADLSERISAVRGELAAALGELEATTEDDETLLEEVAAIVEWPKAVVGQFDKRFLKLPREVLISTLKKHQRYFPAQTSDGDLLPSFVTIANIVSKKPKLIAEGNQKVITPRLEDAVFFFEGDQRRPLSDSIERLKTVVYETSLGSLHDKSVRVATLAGELAGKVAADGKVCQRIAELARADLVSDMVAEFPDLQGIMGGYYAAAGDEPAAVVAGVRDFYRPGFAKDDLPATAEGRLVGLAERLDTLAGVFAAGRKPKGNKDPFGLRRAALGLARLVLEGEIEIDLPIWIERALSLQPVKHSPELSTQIADFVVERLRSYFQFGDEPVSRAVFDAVAQQRPTSLLDFAARLKGVIAFSALPEAESLVAANKRISNILSKLATPVEPKLAEQFESEAERTLVSMAAELEKITLPMIAERRYVDALKSLARLRDPVDTYFDDVMVMVDDLAVREQRLSSLCFVRQLFLNIADVSVMGR